jgi:hypothetical protein
MCFKSSVLAQADIFLPDRALQPRSVRDEPQGFVLDPVQAM